VKTSTVTGRLAAAVLTLLAAMSGSASAQSALPRGDAAGFVAWQIADQESRDPFNRDDWDSSLFGGASAGLYWTQHLKTELDFGASTTSENYRSRQVLIGNAVTFQTSLLESSRRTIGVSQQYQFYENAWFHPHVAAGANFTWERRTEYFHPPYVFDPATGRPLPGTERTEGPSTALTVRPFVAGGFKAYMTPRWFFRADTRFAFKRGFEESQVRVGVGRDW
jgi:hypothetical protein